MRREGSQLAHDAGPRAVISRQGGPLRLEPLAQSRAFLRRLGRLDQVERVPRGKAESVRAERERAEDRLSRKPGTVTQHDRALRNRAVGTSNLRLRFEPLRAALGEPTPLQLVPCRPVRITPEEPEIGVVRRQHESSARDRRQVVRQVAEGYEGQLRRDHVDPVAGTKPGAKQVEHAIGSRVGDDSHRTKMLPDSAR